MEIREAAGPEERIYLVTPSFLLLSAPDIWTMVHTLTDVFARIISGSPFRSMVANETVLAVRNRRGVVLATLSSLQTDRSETGQRVSLVSGSGCILQTGVSRLAVGVVSAKPRPKGKPYKLR